VNDPRDGEDWRLRTGVEAILRCEGHDDDEVQTALDGDPHTVDCDYTTVEGWRCEDEDGTPNHPLQDRAYELAELLDVALGAIDDKLKHRKEWAVWWGAGDNPRCDLMDDEEDALRMLPFYVSDVPCGVEYRDVTVGQWVTTKTLPPTPTEGGAPGDAG
jgi:hypothetical protein